jgi:hypothetical protein
MKSVTATRRLVLNYGRTKIQRVASTKMKNRLEFEPINTLDKWKPTWNWNRDKPLKTKMKKVKERKSSSSSNVTSLTWLAQIKDSETPRRQKTIHRIFAVGFNPYQQFYHRLVVCLCLCITQNNIEETLGWLHFRYQ